MVDVINISDIDTSDRLRPVEQSIVDAYAAIAEERVAAGQSPLIQAIVIRPVAAPGNPGASNGYKLIAGANRLAALFEIGRAELTVGVDVLIRDEDDKAARKSEIYENLAQPGMTALDRAIFLNEGKMIADAERGETRGRKRIDQRFKEDKKVADFAIISSERFSKEAANRLGLSERAVQDAVALASALKSTPDVIAALRATPLADNAQELRAVAELDPDNRRKVVAAIRGGEKTVRDARVAIGLDKKVAPDPQRGVYVALTEAWSKASTLTRKQFMADQGLVEAEK